MIKEIFFKIFLCFIILTNISHFSKIKLTDNKIKITLTDDKRI